METVKASELDKIIFVKSQKADIKNLRHDLNQTRIDFSNEMKNMKAGITRELETVNKRIEETNLAMQQSSMKDYNILEGNILELQKQLKEIRAVINDMRNCIAEFELLPTKIKDLSNNVGGYKRSINKKVGEMKNVVEQSQEKVDKFDDTYKAMVKTIHKNRYRS